MAALMLVAGLSLNVQANGSDIPWTKTFNVSVDKVYAAVVQVASTSFNLQSAVKEANSVTFFTGGSAPWVMTVVCHVRGKGQTLVTISGDKAESNPQLFFLDKEKAKVAGRFWSELEAALNFNETVDVPSNASRADPRNAADPDHPLEITVSSAPDGADIMVDGGFAGNTPSTIRLAAGEHKLVVTKKGFQSWERPISAGLGGQITINVALEVTPANLDYSTPSISEPAQRHEFDKVKYLKSAEAWKKSGTWIDGKINFDGNKKSINFMERGRGTVSFSIQYSGVSRMLYERTAKPQNAAMLLGWPGAFMKSKQHYFTVHYRSEDGSSRFVVLRLDKENVREILATAEAEVGKSVDRTEEK